MCDVTLGSEKSFLHFSFPAAAELREENRFVKLSLKIVNEKVSLEVRRQERGQEWEARERMTTRGQTGAWWETVSLSPEEMDTASGNLATPVCKSSQHNLCNLLLYNCCH